MIKDAKNLIASLKLLDYNTQMMNYFRGKRLEIESKCPDIPFGTYRSPGAVNTTTITRVKGGKTQKIEVPIPMVASDPMRAQSQRSYFIELWIRYDEREREYKHLIDEVNETMNILRPDLARLIRGAYLSGRGEAIAEELGYASKYVYRHLEAEAQKDIDAFLYEKM